MNAPKLTQEQANIISGFTGVFCGNFDSFHADIEKRLGRPIWVHQFADSKIQAEVKEAYRADFLALIPENKT